MLQYFFLIFFELNKALGKKKKFRVPSAFGSRSPKNPRTTKLHLLSSPPLPELRARLLFPNSGHAAPRDNQVDLLSPPEIVKNASRPIRMLPSSWGGVGSVEFCVAMVGLRVFGCGRKAPPSPAFVGIHACREEGRGGHRVGELSSYGLLVFDHWVNSNEVTACSMV